MAAPLRILLADDTSELRRILRSMLELDGFDVVADVGTGAEVVGLVRLGVEVDVIVVDERMPDLDGVATARLVRKAQPGQVVLLYTAFPHGELELAARDAGIAAVLGKADGIEALEREITRFAGSLHPRAGGSAQPPSAQHDELQGGGEEEAGEQQDEHEGGGGAHLRPPGGWGTRPVT